MKNILVLIHDDAGQEARLQAALDLARGVSGHLRCVDVTRPPVFAADPMAIATGGELLFDERPQEQRNRSHVQARLANEGVPFDWVDVMTSLDASLRKAVAMADVVVLNRALDAGIDPGMRRLVGDVLIQLSKPVLAVPEDCRGIMLHGHAMIAWDGSEQAEAAMRAALPLLVLAKQVTVLEVRGGSGTPASEAASYLSRHGIKPVLLSLAPVIDRASTTLLTEIETRAADYLVMGGFGHARFVEALLGGVTRRMLEDSPVPLFLAH